MKKDNMMENTLTYEAAAKELAMIAKEMEDETISVDERTGCQSKKGI